MEHQQRRHARRHHLCCLRLLFSFAILLAACTGKHEESPTTTPEPTATAPTFTATTTPVATPALPAGVRVAMSAIESGDRPAIRRLLQFSRLPCTTELGAGGPPKCAAGESAGTPVEVFEYTACERDWVTLARIDAILAEVFSHPFGRYAIYAASGRYVAVFQATDAPVVGAGVAATVDGDRIVALRRTCGAGDTASALLPRGQTDFLLPPPPR